MHFVARRISWGPKRRSGCYIVISFVLVVLYKLVLTLLPSLSVIYTLCQFLRTSRLKLPDPFCITFGTLCLQASEILSRSYMMAKSLLCEACRTIPFYLLRFPTVSEIPLLQCEQPPKDRFPYATDAKARQTKINISYLSRMKDMPDCPLCSHIWNWSQTVGAYTADGRSLADNREVIVRADVGFQGGLTRWPKTDSDNLTTLFRLVFCTYLEGHPKHGVGNTPHFYLDNHFQCCNIGASKIQVGEDFLDPRPNIDMTVFGGRKRPFQVDFSWIRRWMSLCERDHGEECSALLSTPDIFNMSIVRFVDVKKRCIRSFNNTNLASIRYLALSYVWGRPSDVGNRPVLELNTSTVDKLHQPNILRETPIPETILDVIDLAAELEIPYVWIDRICIIQDDIQDKAAQIGKMHALYNAAFMTIIAAAGLDVYAGLPGLRPDTRHVEQKEIVVVEPCGVSCEINHQHDFQGFSLLTTVEPFIRNNSYLGKSIWTQRGWTMQERVLSRRSLIFTDEQVHFACNVSTFHEETFNELPFPQLLTFDQTNSEISLRSSRTFTEQSDPQIRFWHRFSLLVSRFTARNLSFGGDAHDAFAAIAQALSIKAEEELLWGLPPSQFELALSWNTFSGQSKRTELSTLAMTDKARRIEFPSWSWMGWVGETNIPLALERLETDSPTIRCFVHAHTSEGTKIFAVEELASTTSPFRVELPLISWQNEKDQAVTLEQLAHHIPDFEIRRLNEIPSHHVLYFWASWSKLTVSRPPQGQEAVLIFEPRRSLYCNSCLTVEQHITGAVAPKDGDTIHAQSYAASIVDRAGDTVGSLSRMHNEFWHSGGYDSGEHEFIVVGRRHIAEFGDVFPATLLVMQIERKDGVWYRLAMGEIGEHAWNATNPEWKLIVLG